MRSFRMLLRVIGLATVLAGASACSAVQARAQAHASGVWVEVSPSSIKAGFQIGLRADCGDNANTATVTSKAFGSVTMQPLNSLLQAEAHVPEQTPEGGYDVTLTCRTGASATTTLWVINKGARQSLGPHTGGGFLAQGGKGTTGAAHGLVKQLTSPPIWLLGSASALVLSVAVGAMSVRRRRRLGAVR